MVARALDRMGHRFVALDADEARVLELDLGDFATDPPALAGDVTSPETLMLAGLAKRECAACWRSPRDDRANLAIAVAARLLHPGMRTIAARHTPEAMAAMETCGVTEIINPYREFAERLAIAMRAPDTHRLLDLADRPAGARLPPAAAGAARALDRLRLRPLRRPRWRGRSSDGGFDVTDRRSRRAADARASSIVHGPRLRRRQPARGRDRRGRGHRRRQRRRHRQPRDGDGGAAAQARHLRHRCGRTARATAACSRPSAPR